MIWLVQALLREHGLMLETVCIPQRDSAAAAPWINQPDKLRPFVGFICCNIGLDHVIHAHLLQQRLPVVNIAQRGQAAPQSVWTDLAQADELALDIFQKQGCSHVAVLGIDNQPLVSAQAVRRRGLQAAIMRTAPDPEDLISIEEAGYKLGCTLLRDPRPITGWYLTDDVMARGATRAILALTPDTARRPCVVVRTSRQQMMSLGLPVHYVVFDMEQQARDLVAILLNQITPSVSAEPCFAFCGFSLVHSNGEPPAYPHDDLATVSRSVS
jgi:DNA-binding LacI/PurR family transcriptional regulator